MPDMICPEDKLEVVNNLSSGKIDSWNWKFDGSRYQRTQRFLAMQLFPTITTGKLFTPSKLTVTNNAFKLQ